MRILSEYAYQYPDNTFGIWLFTIGFLMFLAVTYCCLSEKKWVYAGLFMLLTVGCGVCNYVVSKAYMERPSYKRLKVIFDDNYSVEKLYDGYKIVDKDGDIFIIEERLEEK